MAKYLALIRRSDFTDLFKYGSLYLNRLTTIEYDNTSSDLDVDACLIDKLFENANLFESSFTYLIIEFEKADFSLEYPVVDMEDVLKVYPLDREAKKELEISFDEHIRIEEPRWAHAFSVIQKIRTKKECEKGARNVCRLFKIDDETDGFKEIITDDILDEIVSELYRDKKPSGDLPIWVYLLRYERHAFYPEETVGFFMDAVHVVCNYMKKGEADEMDVEQTAVMNFLRSSSNAQAKMLDILNNLASSEESLPFLGMVRSIDERVDFLKVAVLFLFLKRRYQDGLKYEPELVKSFISSSSTRRSFSLASYLMGLVLGHDKTYEALYENLPLQIYKTPEEMAAIARQREIERMRALNEMRMMEEQGWRQKEQRQESGGGFQTGKKRKHKSEGKKPFRSETSAKPSFLESALRGTGPYSKEETQAGPKVEDQVGPMEGQIKESEGETEKKVIEIASAPSSQIQSEVESISSVEPQEESIPIPDLPCEMGKLKSGSQTEFCKSPKPKMVMFREVYIDLYNKGWRIKE